jgi:hypothetical protein
MAKRKITATTDNSDWQAPKKRKPRKPMTEEQRVAAAARLEKAREKRKEKNPDYGQSALPSTLKDLPEDHPRHPKKVKEWIKTQKDLTSSARSAVKQKIKGAEAQLANHEGYIRNMQKYLRDGDWIDNFYGEHQQNKIRHICVALAYHDDGTPKRSIGTYYPDMGCEYTQEIFEEEMGYDRKRSKVKKRNPRPMA